MEDEMLALSWNNHSATFSEMFKKLRKHETYTDVTLSCEGKFYPSHKFVLSTCSEYFESMFKHTPCKHPVIVLSDIKCRELEELLSYMYVGNVNVPQSNLILLMKAADILQVKGLAISNTTSVPCKSPPSTIDSGNDSVSPPPKRCRIEETTSCGKTRKETTNLDVELNAQDKDTHMNQEQEKIQDLIYKVETIMNNGDPYQDALIKQRVVVEDTIDKSDNELLRMENTNNFPKTASIRPGNSCTGISNYNQPQFEAQLQIDKDMSSGTLEKYEWKDGIAGEMPSCKDLYNLGKLQSSLTMLAHQSLRRFTQQEVGSEYALVKFLDDDGSISVVHSSWLDGNYDKARQSAIDKRLPDKENWILHRIRFIMFADTYEEGERRMNEILMQNNLLNATDDEYDVQKMRRKEDNNPTVFDFQRQVRIRLAKIEEMLDQVKNLQYVPTTLINEVEASEDVLNEPMTTPEQVDATCVKLKNPVFKYNMITALNSVGGNSVGATVRKCFQRLGTWKLWSGFNMKGRKNKRAFFDLPLAKVILAACRHVHITATEEEIYQEISETLKHAPSKKGGYLFQIKHSRKRQNAAISTSIRNILGGSTDSSPLLTDLPK